MTPIQRDFQFSLPRERVRDWHAEGEAVSQLFNAMSLFFPEGERFFIASVRNYRQRISAPELNRAVGAFIGQEAMHGREHEAYNRWLEQACPEAVELGKAIRRLLNLVRDYAPKAWQLSVTIALEHYTAVLAHNLLANERMLKDADPQFGQLWLWHALEETEHKGVAYDVWQQAMGRGIGAYALRCSAMAVAGSIFVAMVLTFSVCLIESGPRRRSFAQKLRDYRALGDFMLGEQGLVRSGFADWLKYFRRDFHPWQQDNRALMRRLQELTAPRRRETRRPAAATVAVAAG